MVMGNINLMIPLLILLHVTTINSTGLTGPKPSHEDHNRVDGIPSSTAIDEATRKKSIPNKTSGSGGNIEFPVMAMITISSKSVERPHLPINVLSSPYDIMGERRSEIDDTREVLIVVHTLHELHHLEQDDSILSVKIQPRDIDEFLWSGDATPPIPSSSHRLTLSSNYTTISPHRPCLRDLNGIYQSMFDLVRNDKHNISSVVSIGKSYLKTQNDTRGHTLYVLKLTSPSTNPHRATKKKGILFAISGLHAREWAPPEFAMRFAELLMRGYDVDADITQILMSTEIHLLLHANPDRRHISETDPRSKRRKNMHTTVDCPKVGGNETGVDLNRNFPFYWGREDGASTDPCRRNYMGEYPASEPEVRAIMEYTRKIFPQEQQRNITEFSSQDFAERPPYSKNTTGVFLDLHAYGEIMLWPYMSRNQTTLVNKEYQTVLHKYQEYNGYTLGGPGPHFWYPASGSTLDWAFSNLGTISVGLEFGTQFYEQCSKLEKHIIPANFPVLLYSAKIASAPYSMPGGPDVMDITLSDYPLFSNSTLRIEAVVSDNIRSSLNSDDDALFNATKQNISCVRVYVDEHPYFINHDGNDSNVFIHSGDIRNITMDPIDGDYDSETEAVVTELSMSNFRDGKHILHIQATDSDGQMGPVSSVFFHIE